MEVILTHENADFDAIASLVAASKLFPAATPVLPRNVNRNCRGFLALYGAEFTVTAQQDLPKGATVERAILVDTQGLHMIRGMNQQTRVDIIDHHARDRELPDDWSFTGEPLGAVTTLLIESMSARGLSASPIEATLFLLGIHEDTGSLSYKNTTVRDVRAAAWLLERDADLNVVNEFLHHPLSLSQRELYEALLEQSETHTIAGHTIVVACTEAPGFEDEISTVAHKLRDLLDPAGLFVLVALNSHVQLVARSSNDQVDVSTAASHFGGGGHPRAAAALVRDRALPDVHDALLDVLQRTVRPSATVGQIMSRGVQVLAPDDTVARAADRMKRTGHEGYPVIEDDRILGLLTRRAVDRTLHFEMEETPVAQVMKAGQVSISPQAPVEELRQLMIDSGWGQIPVVEGRDVLGVVTRTDLITLWGTPPRPRRRQEIAQLLRDSLPEPVVALVRRVSQEAQQIGAIPYFVGGLVRDLLLELPIVDIDLVIEGDAMHLTRRLADRFGGRARTHRQFGTGKWILSPPTWRAVTGAADAERLPESIDLVTARTEFYTHPTALPEVESSSIKQDLHRRDFTINTLAIRLDPDHWGELLDFYGGEEDLEEGVIRVLHSLSFVDDPTRMLRAARLEARLGFHLDSRSEQLVRRALPLLDRVSGARVRHELMLTMQEKQPERVLCRMDELGLLAAIQPGLTCDEWLCARFARLRHQLDLATWDLTPDDVPFLYGALLAYRLPPFEVRALSQRLRLPSREAQHLLLVLDLDAAVGSLAVDATPSAVTHTLEPFPRRVIAAVWAASEEGPVRRHLIEYGRQWRHVETALTGNDLKEMGLKPGPLFGHLLGKLKDARLDGQVSCRADEVALIRALLTREAQAQDGPGPERDRAKEQI